jgi:hypothetical protein
LSDADRFPREALQWALDNWDDASPRLVSRLRAYAAGAAGPRPSLDALFFIVHLCGERSDARAYAPVCEIIANDRTLGDWFGDAVAETLPNILINICDGDDGPLKRAIESPKGDAFARGAALSALGYLARARNLLADDEMREYLAKLAREMKPRAEDAVWTAWAFTVAQLGYETMRAEVARVFSKGWIVREDAGLDDFYAELRLSRRDADGLAAFHEAGIAPFGSTIQTLYDLDADPGDDSGPDDRDWPSHTSLVDPQTPFISPFRDVGRNDPCPCGSGKKFKKCCLPA